MMKGWLYRKRAGLALLAWGIGLLAAGQNVTVDATIDSLQLLIGEQTKIRIEVSCDAGRRLSMPVVTDTIVAGVEVVEVAKPDTQYLNDRQRLLITQEYTVTSFDPALYYLPPFEVQVDEQPFRSKSLALNVLDMPVDTLNPDAFFGPKDIMEPPFAWEDWALVVWLSLLLIPLVVLIVYLTLRYRDNKPIVRIIKVEPKLPPHQQAMKEIERIKAERSWQNGEAKAYYTELTDALRTYIKERFGFNALEMTSTEIIERLQAEKDRTLMDELTQLFQTADLVKFAKHHPMMNENDMNLVNAIDFINRTKQEADPNAVPQPTEITVEEKRSRRAKVVLAGVIGVLAVAAAVVIVVVLHEIYTLCF